MKAADRLTLIKLSNDLIKSASVLADSREPASTELLLTAADLDAVSKKIRIIANEARKGERGF